MKGYDVFFLFRFLHPHTNTDAYLSIRCWQQWRKQMAKKNNRDDVKRTKSYTQKEAKFHHLSKLKKWMLKQISGSVNMHKRFLHSKFLLNFEIATLNDQTTKQKKRPHYLQEESNKKKHVFLIMSGVFTCSWFQRIFFISSTDLIFIHTQNFL